MEAKIPRVLIEHLTAVRLGDEIASQLDMDWLLAETDINSLAVGSYMLVRELCKEVSNEA